jgi:hypothetical protein
MLWQRWTVEASMPKCNGRHAASVHDAFMGASASVSLMTDEGDKYDEMLMSTL